MEIFLRVETIPWDDKPNGQNPACFLAISPEFFENQADLIYRTELLIFRRWFLIFPTLVYQWHVFDHAILQPSGRGLLDTSQQRGMFMRYTILLLNPSIKNAMQFKECFFWSRPYKFIKSRHLLWIWEHALRKFSNLDYEIAFMKLLIPILGIGIWNFDGL